MTTTLDHGFARFVARACPVAAMLMALACNEPKVDDAIPSEPVPVVAEPTASASAAPRPLSPNVNALLQRVGAPTFIRGSKGDDSSDLAIAVQIGLVEPLFPNAMVIDDVDLDQARWPDKPIVYGGAHVNEALGSLALPFELSPGKLVIGGETFVGDDYFLIAVVPGAAPRPDLLLYAGTGTPGIAEINAIPHGSHQILVADAFGPLATGEWQARGDEVVARLHERSQRVSWRGVDASLPGAGGGTPAALRFFFVEKLPARQDESELIAASLRGLQTVVRKLAIAAPVPMSIYVHPDRASKRALTGNGGDGHAVPAARALHVIAGPSLESLVAHEGTHVLGYHAWGPAGSPLLGEGMAVWASGAYAGRSLPTIKPEIAAAGRSSIESLLHPKGFRSIKEPIGYPLAGLLFEALVGDLGAARVREHLLGANVETWGEACTRAGTSPEAVEEILARHLGP